MTATGISTLIGARRITALTGYAGNFSIEFDAQISSSTSRDGIGFVIYGNSNNSVAGHYNQKQGKFVSTKIVSESKTSSSTDVTAQTSRIWLHHKIEVYDNYFIYTVTSTSDGVLVFTQTVDFSTPRESSTLYGISAVRMNTAYTGKFYFKNLEIKQL